MRPVYTVRLWREHEYREPSVGRDAVVVLVFILLSVAMAPWGLWEWLVGR